MASTETTRPGLKAATDAAKRILTRLEEQAELRAKADALTRENKMDLAICEARLGDAKREELTAKISIVRKSKPGSVSWKDVAIEEIGAEAAAELQRNAPPKEFVEVQYIG